MRSSFIDVGDVTLHVRTAGSGPAMLLIHQAPISARTLESRIDRLSADFCCIAPDLPGLGESDALAGGLVTVERMARMMLGLMDALGIERAVLYGQHTGALVATELAIVAPDRVAAVLVGGYPIYTGEESAHRVTGYAPELPAPSWDGGHLAWLWHRYREQFVYWPWNAREPRMRASCAIPSPAFLQAGAGEIASRHASYAAVYHAAFDYDAEGALARVSVPVHFILDVADSLSRKIELAAGANPSLRRWPGPTDRIEAIEHAVARDAAEGLPRFAPAALPVSTRRTVLAWDDGAVGLWRPAGDGRACLVLPPFPAGPRAVLPEFRQQKGRAFTLVEFLRLPDEGREREWTRHFVAALADAMPAGRFDVVAAGGAAALATALLDALPERIGAMVMLDPEDRGDGTPFDAGICASGGHMLRLWDRLRFERMRPPAATPEDPATVRGRYESLDLLGRYGWDAVQRIEGIPAWDRLVAALAGEERSALRSSRARYVLTGIDRRGKVPPGGLDEDRATLVAGQADAPFATAMSFLEG